MAYIQLHTEEEQRAQAQVAREFQADLTDSGQRELVEYIAAKSRETVRTLERSKP